jgi:hypothetical protein
MSDHLAYDNLRADTVRQVAKPMAASAADPWAGASPDDVGVVPERRDVYGLRRPPNVRSLHGSY